MSSVLEREGQKPAGIEQRAPLVLVSAALLAICVWIVVGAIRSRGYYWNDDYSHLWMSRQAVHHPTRLLDVWGRPIMTAVYIPASLIGDAAVRLTSLLLAAFAAVLCFATVKRLGMRTLPLAVVVLLLAQPLPAMIAYSALPQIVFTMLLALALFLEASGRPRAAAFAASMLPLARLEGLAVLVVWSVWSVSRRRIRDVPILAIGVVAWALVGALVYHDPLWLAHASPYGIVGTRFAVAGWRYGFKAAVQSFGPAVLALALVTGPRAMRRAPLAFSITVGLFIFYVFAWGLGDFNTLATPVYLVSLSAPLAIWCAMGLDDLLDHGSLVPSAVAVVAFAIVAGSPRVFLLGALFLALVFATRARLLRSVTAFAVICVIAVAVAFPLIKPHPLKGLPAALKEVASKTDNKNVIASTDTPYDWYAKRNTHTSSTGLAASMRRASPGSMFVVDSRYSARFLRPGVQRLFGVKEVLRVKRNRDIAAVLVRVADENG